MARPAALTGSGEMCPAVTSVATAPSVALRDSREGRGLRSDDEHTAGEDDHREQAQDRQRRLSRERAAEPLEDHADDRE